MMNSLKKVAMSVGDVARRFTSLRGSSTPAAAGRVLIKKAPVPSGDCLTRTVGGLKFNVLLVGRTWGTSLKAKGLPRSILATASTHYHSSLFQNKQTRRSKLL